MNNILAGVMLGGLLFTTSANATVIGSLLTGSSGTVTAFIDHIDFNNDPSALGGTNFGCPAAGPCNSDVATGTNLTFAGCASGVLDSAGCLGTKEGIQVLSPLNAGSVGAGNFMTFADHSMLQFSLTGVQTYSNTNCAALAVTQSCVVFNGSPILLTLVSPSSTTVTLVVFGTASDTGPGGLATGSPYQGSFSQTLTGPLPNGDLPTPANIQNYFCPSGVPSSGFAGCSTTNSITSSQSGSFFAAETTGVPEPGTIPMSALGVVLVLIGLRGKHKQTR